MNVNLNYWKAGLKTALLDVSDEQAQRDIWFGNSNYVDNPGECVCRLFDDFAFKDFIKLPELNLTKEQLAASHDLLEKFALFSETESVNEFGALIPKDTIDDPKWQDIRRSAQHLYDLIKNI